jgi:ferrous-iron efflux pump FieF
MSGHDHNHHGLSVAASSDITRRVTRYAVAVALILMLMKAYAWWFSGSVALLASLADSTLDLVASLVTFFAVRYAATPPDEEHRFGHGKAEAFASLIQAGLVFASAALVGREAIASLIHPQPVGGERMGMTVMVLSIVLTGLLIAAQNQALRKTGSVAVSGDRAHYASDLASNLVALIGIGVYAATGYGRVDAIAGLLVAGLGSGHDPDRRARGHRRRRGPVGGRVPGRRHHHPPRPARPRRSPRRRVFRGSLRACAMR